ncbi:interleukin 12 receptor, beta 2a, like isoform X2 [Hoplias malabaricus]
MESESQVFNTGNIHEPLPPVFKDHILDPLDIIWTMQDIVEGGSSPEWLCEVQYKNEYDMKWTEAEDFHGTNFVLFYPVPFTTYTFRVRCGALGERLIMSDWNLYIVKIPAAAPDGKLEVWSDCESNSEEPSCTILWKEMPKIQARGLISSYVLELELNNGSNKHEVYTPAGTCTTHGMLSGGTGSMNSVSRTGQSNLTCYQCCVNSSQFTVPIWMVKGIKVMAKSSEGMSSPAHVAFPRTGRQITGVVLTVTGDRQFLNVSWSVPSQFTVQSVQGYVVQSKPIGQLPEVSLNWVRVHRNLTFATLRGAFQNYTAYNVSLFAVFMNFSQLLQSAVVFSVEGVPPKITDFGVTNISSVSVTLTWKPIPLNKSRGVILKYMVGLGNETVLNVSSDMNSVLLSELNPDQRYDVWISAVTVAGEGERTVTRFTTTANDKTVLIAVLIMLAFVMILFIVLIFWCNIWPHFRAKLKIPDPINSSLFHQKNNQNWQSSLVPSSLLEHPLTISAVNVVMGPDNTIDPGSDHELIVELPEVDQQKTWPEENGEDRGGALQESGGLERVNSMLLHKTKDYRQVIDSSDEEANREDEDEDEEWFEQTSTSDYEKHFLPCVQDA